MARGIASRVFGRLRRLVPRTPGPSILMYHRLGEDSFDPWGLVVAPELFREQLKWLSANRTVLPLDKFAECHRDGRLPPDAIAITFDDGYECTAKHGAPMLEEAGIAATVFIPAALIERGEPFWWDELQNLVLGHDGEALVLDGQPVSLGCKQAEDSRWDPGDRPRTPRQRAFHSLWAILRAKPPAELAGAMADLRRQAGASEVKTQPRPMTVDQVRATASERIAFGSHAMTHPWLASLEDAEKEREILNSVERCHAIVGTAPRTFAYPYGNFDAASERLAEAAGFVCACATANSAVTPNSRLFALPRVQVGNWTGPQLHRALAHLG
jgi:peptidoglycan/xylan/chitin deacetylase (PgdA/CDA1 family)